MATTLEEKLKKNKLIVDPTKDSSNYYVVQPTPGVVVKFKKARLMFSHDEEQKCFLNIAHCIEIPAPEFDEDEAKLAAMMRVDENCFSLPLSLGDLDCVKDKSNQNALKFDVVINSDYFHQHFMKSEFHQQLTIAAAINKIEAVHQIRITRASQVILKNKKVVGALDSHRIPKNPEKPLEEKRRKIIDITDTKSPMNAHQHENVSMWIEKGNIFKATISMKEKVKTSQLRLEANDDHLLLFIRGEKRVADFFVPFDLDVTSLTAQIIDGKPDETTIEITSKFTLVGQEKPQD